MGFDDLPPEVILKIFSYLPQAFLEVIARVSQRWRQLAFDPSLYKVVCIPSGHGDGPQQAQETLERASMLITLQNHPRSCGLRHRVSSAGRIAEFEAPAMSGVVEHCKSLRAIVLYGRHRLAATDVHMLEALPSLRRLIASDGVEVDDDALQQLCRSCPRLEILEIDSQHICRSESWDYLGGLQQLRILAVNVISTVGLLRVAESCPRLETLEIEVVVNENDISVAEALQGFQALRSLCVILQCGQGWLDGQFGSPPLLHCLKVPRLVLEEAQFLQLIVSFYERLQHVEIDVSMIPDECLYPLSFCTEVKCLHLYGLTGKTVAYWIVCQLPSLTRASLYIMAHPDDAVFELTSIVDPLDRSPRGKTRLVCNVLSSSPEAQDNIMGAATAFTDYLALHTSMAMEHIMDFKRQCVRCNQVTGPPWKVETSFPTISSSLQYLTLDLDEHR
ncbi:hypothetical protein HPB48_017163 [Haemaphysalis longicornis]|uniref:F-box domain-containing protein n=1 Tax=Haemaphysalis longicornis TaxID=44386 RepID=A0A9J6GLH1_HAELO|nr:hypothetical protein HPB48_017163 [Haemaphysalis longicornis]